MAGERILVVEDEATVAEVVGRYLEREGQRVNVPGDIAPDELTPERAAELFDQPSGDRSLGTDPQTGHEIVARGGWPTVPHVDELRVGNRHPSVVDLRQRLSLSGDLDPNAVAAAHDIYDSYVEAAIRRFQARHGVTVDDLIDFTPELRAEALKVVSKYKMGRIFSPPVVSKLEGPLGMLVSPANLGGSNWPGGAYAGAQRRGSEQ